MPFLSINLEREWALRNPVVLVISKLDLANSCIKDEKAYDQE